jgi:hypothetical protein
VTVLWVGVPSGYARDHPLSSPTVDTRNLGASSMTLIEDPGRRFIMTGDKSLTYFGAATIRSGDPLFTQVGRSNEQVPWELSNGITTVTPAAAPAIFQIQTLTAAGAAATQTYEVELGTYTGSYAPVTSLTWDSWTTSRESIEQCSIRLIGSCVSASITYAITLDLILSRGDRGITGILRASDDARWGVNWATPIGSTGVTGTTNALIASSADPDGSKPILVGHDPADNTSTRDTTNGIIYINNLRDGLNIFASSQAASGAANTAAAVCGQFFTPMSQRQRMVTP